MQPPTHSCWMTTPPSPSLMLTLNAWLRTRCVDVCDHVALHPMYRLASHVTIFVLQDLLGDTPVPMQLKSQPSFAFLKKQLDQAAA